MCRKARHDDRFKDFTMSKRRFSIGHKEISEREGTFALPRGQHHCGIEPQQNRRAVSDGRSGHKVAAHGGSIANLARPEHAQHRRQGREFVGHLFFDFSEGDRTTDAPLGIARNDLV